MKKLTAPILSLMFVALLSATVLASSFDRQAPDGRHDKRMERIEQFKELLALSPGQEDQIKTIFTENRQEMRELREAARANQQELKATVDAETLDEPKLRQLVHIQADLRADMMVMQHATQVQVNQVLTPEQRRIRDTLREMKAEHRQSRRGERGAERH